MTARRGEAAIGPGHGGTLIPQSLGCQAVWLPLLGLSAWWPVGPGSATFLAGHGPGSHQTLGHLTGIYHTGTENPKSPLQDFRPPRSFVSSFPLPLLCLCMCACVCYDDYITGWGPATGSLEFGSQVAEGTFSWLTCLPLPGSMRSPEIQPSLSGLPMCSLLPLLFSLPCPHFQVFFFPFRSGAPGKGWGSLWNVYCCFPVTNLPLGGIPC